MKKIQLFLFMLILSLSACYQNAPIDNNVTVKIIVDKTKDIPNFSCAEALESFYEDDTYIYYYTCIKGEYMIVEYLDGSKETIQEALKHQRIKISDLDTYHIPYYKEIKEVHDGNHH